MTRPSTTFAVLDAAPKTPAALLAVRDSLLAQGFDDMEPPDYRPAYKEDYDYSALLLLGQRLGLWSFWATEHGNPHVFIVEYCGQVRRLAEPDVRGWILGVLATLGLGLGPFGPGLGLS